MTEQLQQVREKIATAAASNMDEAARAALWRDELEGVARAVWLAAGETPATDATLLELLGGRGFRRVVDDAEVMESLHFVRKLGINAKHGLRVKKAQERLARDFLLYFLDYLEAVPPSPAEADAGGAPPSAGTPRPPPKPVSLTEAQTRKQYIDLYLQEAGWDLSEHFGLALPAKACIEIHVDGLPTTPNGDGRCDYVLFGRDGKPLAVVEAKRTTVSAEAGRHQAMLYADALEAQYGVRPVVYCTNGYRTICIDGLYPDRRVSGFHSEGELARLIARRGRPALAGTLPKPDIAGRPYQIEALTNLCARFDANHRRGLVVMATGTGKTRVAAALVEMLARRGWIKNVLFLADRTSLVDQARRRFAESLPEFSLCVLSDPRFNKDPEARIVLSTYQTMIGRIDEEDKQFTVGRFDLVVVDEAHRSIFNKYGAIFDYFDAMLVGLTATPRQEVDANTYDLFECESGVPDYDYPLKRAVEDGYLVPYKVVNRTTERFSEGVRYENLTEDEKLRVDTLYPDGAPEVVPPEKLFRLVYNVDTCDKVLADLMGHGIKVDGGETLGKSIVFAYDHRHAQMIVDRFHALWPALPADYCQLVDNTVSRADDLVLDFGQKSGFRIAVSVDMLDTGIDVPEVLNLVFFKPVRSKIKFVQMIGRGTRLCPGVFGPVLPDKSTDKKSFRIFDYCGNFEYFSEGGETEEPESRLGTTGKIRCVQFELLSELQKIEHQSVSGRKAWHGALRSFLRGEVAAVRSRSFRIAVRAEMELLDRFAPERAWDYLAPTDVRKLQHRIVPLMDGDPADPPLSKIFDLRMLRIALARLSGGAWPGPAKKDVEAVMRCATALLKKGSIPQVAAAADDLRHLASAEWWRAPDALDIEDLRKKLRDAMQFLGGEGREAIVVDQEDEVRDGGDPGGELVDIRSYRQKAVDWLADHGDDPAVVKIRNLEKLDPEDWARLEDVLWRKIGGEEDYHAEIGDKPLAAFVRSIVGIDQDAINAKYGEFLTGNVLNPMQQDFVRTIIEYVRQTGDITPDDIIDKPPFCDYDSVELFQERLPDVRSMVEFLHGLIAA